MRNTNIAYPGLGVTSKDVSKRWRQPGDEAYTDEMCIRDRRIRGAVPYLFCLRCRDFGESCIQTGKGGSLPV